MASRRRFREIATLKDFGLPESSEDEHQATCKKSRPSSSAANQFAIPPCPAPGPLPQVQGWLCPEGPCITSAQSWNGARGWSSRVVYLSLLLGMRHYDETMANRSLMEFFSVVLKLKRQQPSSSSPSSQSTSSQSSSRSSHSSASPSSPPSQSQSQSQSSNSSPSPDEQTKRLSSSRTLLALRRQLFQYLFHLILEEVGVISPWLLVVWHQCMAPTENDSLNRLEEVPGYAEKIPGLLIDCATFFRFLSFLPRNQDVPELIRHFVYLRKSQNASVTTEPPPASESLGDHPPSLFVGLHAPSPLEEMTTESIFTGAYSPIQTQPNRDDSAVRELDADWDVCLAALLRTLQAARSFSSSQVHPSVGEMREWLNQLDLDQIPPHFVPAEGVSDHVAQRVLPSLFALFLLLSRHKPSHWTVAQIEQMKSVWLGQIDEKLEGASPVADMVNALMDSFRRYKSQDHRWLVLTYVAYLVLLHDQRLIPAVPSDQLEMVWESWHHHRRQVTREVAVAWEDYRRGLSGSKWPSCPTVEQLESQALRVPSRAEITFLPMRVRFSRLHLSLPEGFRAQLPNGSIIDLIEKPELMERFWEQTREVRLARQEGDRHLLRACLTNTWLLPLQLWSRGDAGEEDSLWWNCITPSASQRSHSDFLWDDPFRPADGSYQQFQVRVATSVLPYSAVVSSRKKRKTSTSGSLVSLPHHVVCWRHRHFPDSECQALMIGPVGEEKSHQQGTLSRIWLFNALKKLFQADGVEWLDPVAVRLLPLPTDEFSSSSLTKWVALMEFYLPLSFNESSIKSANPQEMVLPAALKGWPLRTQPHPDEDDELCLVLPPPEEPRFPVPLNSRYAHHRQTGNRPMCIVDDSDALQELVFLHLAFRWLMGCSNNSFHHIYTCQRPFTVRSWGGEDGAFLNFVPPHYFLTHGHTRSDAWVRNMTQRLNGELGEQQHPPESDDILDDDDGAAPIRPSFVGRWLRMLDSVEGFFRHKSDVWISMIQESGFQPSLGQQWREGILQRVAILRQPTINLEAWNSKAAGQQQNSATK